MKTRVYAMNPMNYIAEYRDGGSVQPARYFRISYGSTDSNTTPTVVFNLGKMLESAGINAEYGLYWGGGHGNFTSKPDETAAFFEWIETSVAEARLADGPVTETVDPAIYLDYSAGIEAGVYSWFESDDGSFWYLVSCDENGEPRHATEGMGAASKYIGAYTSSKITNPSFQGIAVCVPTEYLRFDGGEVCGINYFGTKGGYSALSAPIIYENSNGGWNSGACKISDAAKYIAEGMVYVGAGSRSRDAKDASGMFITGKAPTQVVDLKAGVIALRANSDVIPGNKDLIFSVGASGAGQMSSILGASGDMPEYYEYLYETGAIGVSKTARGYVSRYSDAVCGAQCYCPISDLENADLAYAWMRYDSTFDENGSFTAVSGGKLSTEFDVRLQELEAWAFVDYINGLGLRDARGRSLTLVTPREGSYYDAVLGAMSDALNAWAENTEFPVSVTTGRGESAVTTIYNSAEEYLGRYDNESGWLVKNADGSYSVTDMAGFIIGTGLVRNKTVPGFDTMPNSAENTAFGTSDMAAAHYSSTVAAVLKENYDELSTLEGFNKAQVDLYIEQALDGEIAGLTGYQADLMNATEILLGNNGLSAVSPARFWRTRNGTADQHTSFTIAFNMCAAANAARLDADYSLVWDMGHGSAEGTTTGTFIQWVKDCAKNAYKPSDRPSGGSGSSSGGSASRPEQPTAPTEPETPDIPETVRLPFADVKAGDWFYDDVAYVYEQGMMTGVSGSMFAPGSNTTRGMIVTILYRLEGEPAVSGGSGFADVPSGSYYEKAIAWAAENGIVSGFDAARFGPDENITREQLAAILYRYAAFKGIGASGAESLDGFTDAGSVSAYALEAMRWAVGNGIVTGTGTALAPAGTASRSQAAAMLHRFCVLTA